MFDEKPIPWKEGRRGKERVCVADRGVVVVVVSIAICKSVPIKERQHFITQSVFPKEKCREGVTS